MKRNFVSFISISALAILISIQGYIIINYYKLKSKDFDLIYSKGIIDAMETVDYNIGTDTLNIEFNNLSLQLISDSYNDSSWFQNKVVQTKLKQAFDSLLNQYETNTAIIRNYLCNIGMDTLIHAHYTIREIALINSNEQYTIYKLTLTDKPEKEKGLFINSYYKEGNYYAIRYEYYIDFTKKHRIILTEMKGLFLIVFITIIAVITAFSLTLKALDKQKKLSELKGDFIDNITHEFKTPLSSLSVAISSLKHPLIKENAEKYVDILKTMEKQNWYLTEMIDHVIDVSLLDRKAFAPNKKSVSLKPYIQEIVKTFLENNTGKNIHIIDSYSIPEGYAYCLDQVQFSRVINNLLSNSFKYCIMDPIINLNVKIENQLILEFSDNGIGISEECQKNVFTKFYRAENQIKTKGLGLGLYIVKNIIENHQGTIKLNSNPNVGTKFTISLPV